MIKPKLQRNDLTVIRRALTELIKTYEQDEHSTEHPLSPKERQLLQQLRTAKKKIKLLKELYG